jgi:hypothetical protein
VLALFWAQAASDELLAVYKELNHANLSSFAFDMRYVAWLYVRHLHAWRLYGVGLSTLCTRAIELN